MVEVKKTYTLNIEKGVLQSFMYTIKGEGDCPPKMEAGDLNVEVRSPDFGGDFRRRGADLILRKALSLVEAVTGYSFTFTHLDGTVHLIYSQPGEIVAPGTVKTIEDMGMPFFRDPIKHGNLFVMFEVEYPPVNYFTFDVIDRLRGALGGEQDTAEEEWGVPPENVHWAEDFDIRFTEKKPECLLNKPLSRKPKKPPPPPPQYERQYYQGGSHTHCSGTLF